MDKQREGPPLDVEQHNFGRPDKEPVKQPKRTWTLLEMAEEIEFFTTALINTVANFDRDPVIEFNRMYPTEVRDELPFAIDYSEPFFQGLGMGLLCGHPVNWDRRLYGIRRDRWEQCRDTIGGIAIMDPKTQAYSRVCFYQLEIVDPTTLKAKTVIDVLPMLPITVFAINNNRNFVWLAPPDNPPLSLPYVSVEPPRPDIQVEGARVLGPPPAPEQLLPRNREKPT